MTLDETVANQCLVFDFVQRNPVGSRQEFNGIEPNVVPGPVILCARVSQASDDVHLYPPGCVLLRREKRRDGNVAVYAFNGLREHIRHGQHPDLRNHALTGQRDGVERDHFPDGGMPDPLKRRSRQYSMRTAGTVSYTHLTLPTIYSV